MGENDTYSLISYNCQAMLAEFFGPLSDDHGTKQEIIADIIHQGNADYKTPRTSPGKELLSSYLTAMCLTGR